MPARDESRGRGTNLFGPGFAVVPRKVGTPPFSRRSNMASGLANTISTRAIWRASAGPRFVLAALTVVVIAAAGPARAAERTELVVLLHPTIKDWAKPMAAALAQYGGWAVESYNPKGRYPVLPPEYRFEVGK